MASHFHSRSHGIVVFPLLAIMGLLASCASPVEIDTPREKTYLDSSVSHRVAVRQIAVSFNDNAVTLPRAYQYDCVWDSPVEIDTSTSTPVIWMHGTCTAPPGSELALVLRSLVLRLDSLKVPALASVDGNGQEGEMVFTLDGGATTEAVTADGAGNLLLLRQTTYDRTGRHLVLSVEIDATLFGRAGLMVLGTMSLDY